MEQVALVFDLDGTLFDSLPDLRAALNEMLRGLARRELSADEVRRMIGDATHTLVGRALRATAEVVDLENPHQRFLDFYEAAPTRLSRLYPDVATTLHSLIGLGARLAICTNKQQAATLAVLNRQIFRSDRRRRRCAISKTRSAASSHRAPTASRIA
jgi:phosphoglycolate phosphatase